MIGTYRKVTVLYADRDAGMQVETGFMLAHTWLYLSRDAPAVRGYVWEE